MASKFEVCCPHCGLTCSPDSRIHPVCSNCGRTLTTQGQPLGVDDAVWEEVKNLVRDQPPVYARKSLRMGSKPMLSHLECVELVDALVRDLLPQQIPPQQIPLQQAPVMPLATAPKQALTLRGWGCLQAFMYVFVACAGWIILLVFLGATDPTRGSNDPTDKGAISLNTGIATVLSLILIGFICVCFIQVVIHYLAKAATKPKLRPRASAPPIIVSPPRPTPQQEVQNTLATLNGYDFSQVHIAQNCISGIAADTVHNVICILGRGSVLQEVKTNLLFPPKDILQVEIIEDGFSKTDSVSQAVTESEMRTSGANMVGRAVVGGVLFGPAGAVIGGATAKRKGQEFRSETTQGITRDMVNRVDLRILVNDPVKPLYNVNFLDAAAYRGSPLHQEAIDRANHWQAVINVLRLRS